MPIHLFKPKTSRFDTVHHSNSNINIHENAPLDIPISALRITLKGTHERITSTYSKFTPPAQFGDFRYYLLQCLESPIITTPIRRISFEFTNEDKSMGTSKEQQAFLGVYCIWYQENDRPKSAREYEAMDGEFWITRQVQWRPEVGETIEWEDVPEGMDVGMEEEWWFKGSVLPRMKWLMKGGSNEGVQARV